MQQTHSKLAARSWLGFHQAQSEYEDISTEATEVLEPLTLAPQ
jgi:hypothetical protein